jgi:hypothetical protein
MRTAHDTIVVVPIAIPDVDELTAPLSAAAAVEWRCVLTRVRANRHALPVVPGRIRARRSRSRLSLPHIRIDACG